jgi:hypothetical protein
MDIDCIIMFFSSLLLIENENKTYSILNMIYLSSEIINIAYFNFNNDTTYDFTL